MMLRKILLTLSLMGLLTACSETQYEYLLDRSIDSQRWLASWQPHTVDINGINVAYLDNQHLNASQTILFVHGYTGNKDMWNRLVTRLPNDYRFIAIDLLGHGDTANAPDNRYLLMQQVKLIKEFSQRLDLKHFHLVGSSMGGATSLLYALHHSDQVESLTLMNSAGVHALEESEFELAIKQGKNPMAIQNVAQFDAMMALIFNQPPWLPDGFKNVLAKRAATRHQHYQYVFSEVILSSHIWRDSGRIYGLIPDFKKPVLVIWGDDDRVLHPSSMAIFKEHMPQAETHMLVGTGHVPMLEKPAETAEILQSFLNQQINNQKNEPTLTQTN